VSVAEVEAVQVGRDTGGGGLWSDAWSRLRRDQAALVGFGLVGTFVFIAIFAPFIAPDDPRFQDL